ncbi:MAG TPA: hypothetical protein VJZ27_15805, partial [Aggregatilineales bacterium]|nr:hypothetical protein [Aggregatilineales bacterium]
MRIFWLCGLVLLLIIVWMPEQRSYACGYQPDPSSPRSASLGQMPLDYLVREATHIIVGDIVLKKDRDNTISTIILVDEYLKGNGSSVVEVAEIEMKTTTLPCQSPPIPLGIG